MPRVVHTLAFYNSGACRGTATWAVRSGRCCINRIEDMILSPTSIYVGSFYVSGYERTRNEGMS